MFKKILIPLDGSNLAEASLSPAVALAKKMEAPIVLLHVIEEDAPQEIHNDHHLDNVEDAVKYLDKISKKISSENIHVEGHVHSAKVKDVAASINQHANEEFNSDLIVMCAHGKSGFRDLIFGNIAQQVLADGRSTILLMQSEIKDSPPFSLKRILIPLDSQSIHDESLIYGMGLAKAFDAELYILTIIPTYSTLSGEDAAVGKMLPGTVSAFLDILENEAKDHVQLHLDECLKAGISTEAEIGRGDPATLIVSTAERTRTDLIVLSTHKKAGIEAFWSHSVAPSVIKKTHIPLLLIPLN